MTNNAVDHTRLRYVLKLHVTGCRKCRAAHNEFAYCKDGWQRFLEYTNAIAKQPKACYQKIQF